MPVDTAEALKAQNQVIFLENFADELQRKVPGGEIASDAPNGGTPS